MNIFQMSFSAGILIAVITLIRAAAKNYLPKNVFLILWGIVLLRLFLPVSIPVLFLNRSIPALYQAAAAGAGLNGNKSSMIPLFYLIWGTGAAALGIFFTVCYKKSSRILKEALPIQNSSWMEQWCREAKLLRKVTIFTSDQILTPVTCGFFRPKIILPKNLCVKDKLQMSFIMEHELVHIRRLDNLWKILSAAALCLHWYHPLVWIFYSLVNRDLEITCDERVIRKVGEEKKRAYADTLIHLAESGGSTPFPTQGFGKTAIYERMVLIMKFKKTSAVGIVCAAILVAGAICVFAGNSEETGKPESLAQEKLAAKVEGTETESKEEKNDIYVEYLPEDGSYNVDENGTNTMKSGEESDIAITYMPSGSEKNVVYTIEEDISDGRAIIEEK